MHFVPTYMSWRHGMEKRIEKESKLEHFVYEQNKRGGFSMQKRCRVICRLKHENLIMIIIL